MEVPGIVLRTLHGGGGTISSSGSPWATLNPMTSNILISTCPAGSRSPLGSTLIIRSWEEVQSRRANPWGSHRCQRTSANMNSFNPPSDPDLHYCSFSTDQETPRLKVQAIGSYVQFIQRGGPQISSLPTVFPIQGGNPRTCSHPWNPTPTPGEKPSERRRERLTCGWVLSSSQPFSPIRKLCHFLL